MNKIVLGLGFGDEGKGSIVDFLSFDADIVCRFNGGCQAAHNVMSENKHHMFSQFGSGSLRGLPTYLDEMVIVDPSSMFNEYMALYKLTNNPHINVNENCLVVTPFHAAANRILDKSNNHGSCGVGIGLTREMWSKTGDGLRWGDLFNKKILRRKLLWIKQWCIDRIADYNSSTAYPLDLPMENIFNHLFDDARKCAIFSDIVDLDILKNKRIIFEGAQGFLLDQVYGTIPHTTYSDTTPARAIDICDELHSSYEIVGVTRSYETRHGNGPMHNELDVPAFLTSDHNYDNGAFAGKFRFGKLSESALEDAIKICNVHYLAVNHLDQHALEFTPSIPIAIEGHGPRREDKLWNKSWSNLSNIMLF